MSQSEEKNALRKIYKEKRATLLDSRAEAAYISITAKEEYKRAKVIFCYISVGSEVSTRKIIEGALAEKKTVLVPRIYRKGEMEAVEIRSFADTVSGRFNIPEPQKNLLAYTGKIDLAIVPALAFDKRGFRLGYGGGYYDRFLAGETVYSIGLCHRELLAESLPREEFDISVSEVCTV